ncbi:MAG TPA: S53 family peptidase [Acidobacteriaceae bacterium]|nr:S53 family peptidase [Acidobacteriaceae bacterium]
MRSLYSGPSRMYGLLVLLLAAASVALPCSAQTSADDALAALRSGTLQRRVTPGADFSARVQLAGHLPRWARTANETAQASASERLNVTVVLKRDAATQAAFEQLLADQQNPTSPLYHHWLTPSQVGSTFGIAPADLQSVESWLQSQGLRVDSVEPNGVLINASGSVADASSAFRTNFAHFRVGAETRLSATEEPSVPAALQAVIAGVHGLSQSSLHPQSKATVVTAGANVENNTQTSARPQLTASDGSHYLTPNDFATIYDISPVYAAGNTGATVSGKAQRIAIVGRSGVAATDISQFESMTGLPSAQPNTIVATGGVDPGVTKTGDQDEATLDVDRAMGTAPGAGIDLVVSADTKTVSGVYLAANYAINTLVDPILSISFGDCEANAGAQGVAAWDQLFSAAAAEGITVLVSSGDSGAAGCDGDSTNLPATQVASINYICSSSYATCVGGTQFADTTNAGSYWSSQNGSGQSSAVSYIPEGAWNEPTTVGVGNTTAYQASGTGGGASQYVAKPGWQTGNGVPADGQRDVPDVSLNSAEHDGYFACLQYAGGDCSQKAFEVFGGTSAAAPGMAGIVALLNTATGTPVGNLNPLLYKLGADATNGAYHDVTVESSGVNGCSLGIPSLCNNSTPSASGLAGGLAGFQVAAGYDQATGWGSVDVNKFIAAVTASTSSSSTGDSGSSGSSGSTGTGNSGTTTTTAPTFSLGSTSSALSISAGSDAADAINVATSNGFNGTIKLTCAVSAANGTTSSVLPTCTMSPATVSLAGTKGSASANASVSIVSQATANSACSTGSGSPNVRIGGLALASLCLLLIPAGRVRKLRGLTLLVIAGAGLSLMTGCGAATVSSLSSACSAPSVTQGTTPGNYVVTVTGASGSTTASTSFSVAVASSPAPAVTISK